MCKRDNIPSSQLSSHVRLREPFLPARRLGQKERSLLRGTRRRDRNSSAVPPFLAGLSGSLTQPALCSPDIAGMRRILHAGLRGRFHPSFREALSICLLLCRNCSDVLFLFFVTFFGKTEILCVSYLKKKNLSTEIILSPTHSYDPP